MFLYATVYLLFMQFPFFLMMYSNIVEESKIARVNSKVGKPFNLL